MPSAVESVWDFEEQLWTGGPDVHDRLLAQECVMAFPGVGLMDRSAALEGLNQAPRWTEVDMQMRRSAAFHEAVVLGYRADARREEGEPYRVWCTSTYRGAAARWHLIQHQQTMAD